MAKQSSGAKSTAEKPECKESPATRSNAPRSKPSALLDIRVVHCGDKRRRDVCGRWGETKETRAFEDRHENN